ncbi:MAG: hypothetical protein CM15mV73_480 [Caudoviricetes sp.]|nr:MAG: hypothetical protein CM15mV73_480 [Caudoviricetes sp.]
MKLKIYQEHLAINWRPLCLPIRALTKVTEAITNFVKSGASPSHFFDILQQ